MKESALIKIFLMTSLVMLVLLSSSINNFLNVMAFETDNDDAYFDAYFNQKKPTEEIVVIEKLNLNERNKLVVVSNVNLQNIQKIGKLKIVAVINGEGFIKDIPLDEIDETKQKLRVKFVMNNDNEFVSADKLDEYFVCAYHLEDSTQYSNSLPFFDCDEGDLAGSDATTIARLFNPTSQVYAKSAYYHDMNSPSKETSFATISDGYTPIEDEYSLMEDGYTSLENDEYANYIMSDNSAKLDYNNQNSINPNEEVIDNNFNSNNKPVTVKIIVPMEDKKNAEKIKIMAMLKGQIKSTVIDDVQKEFDKIGGYTIERTFSFDRNTDMGPIQVGDRFHACVIGQDLNPPEGSECEKKLIKYLDNPNPLAVR